MVNQLRRRAGIPTLIVLIVASAQSAGAGQLDSEMAQARQLLDAARQSGSEAGYRQAYDAFARVVAANPDNAIAVLSRGQATFAWAQSLAVQGKFGPSVERFQSGMADMNKAVALAPAAFDTRLARGLAYGPFRALYKLSPLVREDLELVTAHEQFTSLPAEQRSRVWLLLGNAYADTGARDRALEVLRRASTAAPGTKPASDADVRIAALETGGSYQPDRFPRVSADTSPVLLIVSFTRPSATPESMQGLIRQTMAAIEHAPGFLAQRSAASLDVQGQFFLFTRWKDKQAVNAFYYSDLHQQLAGHSEGRRSRADPCHHRRNCRRNWRLSYWRRCRGVINWAVDSFPQSSFAPCGVPFRRPIRLETAGDEQTAFVVRSCGPPVSPNVALAPTGHHHGRRLGGGRRAGARVRLFRHQSGRRSFEPFG